MFTGVFTLPAKVESKLFRHGNSLVAVIPKPYREYHQLKPGETLTVLYDSLILIVPKKLEPVFHEKKPLIDQLLGQGGKQDGNR
ncbi:MAG TPA: AbrB/MazE/SpoVT family DNA-binding domain-containing protein [Candidatus Bathyarchaeota archaeon]|nr:AbrB/MazE/SpoVT family DNA-binding domain-containing protein [Candidatus Bathyarchaeota archaeon]